MPEVTKADPNVNDVHVNQPMTDISVAYMQDADEFIADQIFPRIPVEKKSDKYFTYDRNDWLRDEAEVRGPSQETVGGGYGVSTDTYTCDVWGYHKDLDDQVRANYDNPLDPERDTTEFVTHKLLIKRDVLFTSNYFSATPWDNDYTGGSSGSSPDFVYWSDDANSDPIGDVTGWRRSVKKNTGFKPNVMAIGGEVWDEIKDNPDIIERIKYTRDAININQELVAQAFDLDNLVVAEAIQASNQEGATESYEQIVGKEALLVYVPESPSLLTPSAGYIFTWNGYGGQNSYGVTIRDFRMEPIRSDRFEGEMAFDMKPVASALGVYLDSVVS